MQTNPIDKHLNGEHTNKVPVVSNDYTPLQKALSLNNCSNNL